MALLLVDIGNTRIKWARLSGDRLGRSRAAVHAAWSPDDYARRLFGASRPERVLVSSVAAPAVNRSLARATRRGPNPPDRRFLPVVNRVSRVVRFDGASCRQRLYVRLCDPG